MKLRWGLLLVLASACSSETHTVSPVADSCTTCHTNITQAHPNATIQFESLMRAAHSLKGAARIVNHQPAVTLAHAFEDCFVAAQHGKIQLRQDAIDTLLQGVDLAFQPGDVG